MNENKGKVLGNLRCKIDPGKGEQGTINFDIQLTSLRFSQ